MVLSGVKMLLNIAFTCTSDGKTGKSRLELDLSANPTVLDLKLEIQKILKAPVCDQKLFYQGRPLLSDSLRITDLYIRENDELYLEFLAQAEIEALDIEINEIKNFHRKISCFLQPGMETCTFKQLEMPNFMSIGSVKTALGRVGYHYFTPWKQGRALAHRHYFVQEGGFEAFLGVFQFSQKTFDSEDLSMQHVQFHRDAYESESEDEEDIVNGVFVFDNDNLAGLFTLQQLAIQTCCLGLLWNFTETAADRQLGYQKGGLSLAIASLMVDPRTEKVYSRSMEVFWQRVSVNEEAIGCVAGFVEHCTEAQRLVASNKLLIRKVLDMLIDGEYYGTFYRQLAINLLFYCSFDAIALQKLAEQNVHLKVMQFLAKQMDDDSHDIVFRYYSCVFLARTRTAQRFSLSPKVAGYIDSLIERFMYVHTPDEIADWEDEHSYVWITLKPLVHLAFAGGRPDYTADGLKEKITLSGHADSQGVEDDVVDFDYYNDEVVVDDGGGGDDADDYNGDDVDDYNGDDVDGFVDDDDIVVDYYSAEGDDVVVVVNDNDVDYDVDGFIVGDDDDIVVGGDSGDGDDVIVVDDGNDDVDGFVDDDDIVVNDYSAEDDVVAGVDDDNNDVDYDVDAFVDDDDNIVVDDYGGDGDDAVVGVVDGYDDVDGFVNGDNIVVDDHSGSEDGDDAVVDDGDNVVDDNVGDYVSGKEEGADVVFHVDDDDDDIGGVTGDHVGVVAVHDDVDDDNGDGVVDVFEDGDSVSVDVDVYVDNNNDDYAAANDASTAKTRQVPICDYAIGAGTTETLLENIPNPASDIIRPIGYTNSDNSSTSVELEDSGCGVPSSEATPDLSVMCDDPDESYNSDRNQPETSGASNLVTNETLGSELEILTAADVEDFPSDSARLPDLGMFEQWVFEDNNVAMNQHCTEEDSTVHHDCQNQVSDIDRAVCEGTKLLGDNILTEQSEGDHTIARCSKIKDTSFLRISPYTPPLEENYDIFRLVQQGEVSPKMRWPGSRVIQALGVFSIQHLLFSRENRELFLKENLLDYLVCLQWQLRGGERTRLKSELAEKFSPSQPPSLRVVAKSVLAQMYGFDAVARF